MENNINKEIIKFIKPSLWHNIGGIIFVTSGIILLIPIMLVPLPRRALEVNIYLDITSFVLGIGLLLRAYIIKRKVLKTIDKIESIGGEYMLHNDFYNGERLYCGNIILGNKFIIGKGMGTIVAYDDIMKVYIKIYKRHFVEMCRILKIVNENGNIITVCTVSPEINNDNDTYRIFDIMKSRNSRIKFRVR